jgi:hypothetical protein
MKTIVKVIDGQCVYTKVNMDHNHNIVSSPSLTKFFINHKKMSEEEKTFSKILQDARIKSMRIMSIFRELKGTFKNVSFTTKNLDTLKQKERTKLMDTDIDATVKYLKKLQLENEGIDYTMRFDDQNTVRSIYLTDGRGKMDY